ncbi:hypothetical protein M9H77_12853 [Catharanthus roseus]|uniref:Uncharacterized protein n=1 Tax=Catharanthus roseus TaxID=4058 RepID=A0ACC0BIR6_CATRO|nr:hypothetical protein M9H77_12853 [Catharanthus roseus]
MEIEVAENSSNLNLTAASNPGGDVVQLRPSLQHLKPESARNNTNNLKEAVKEEVKEKNSLVLDPILVLPLLSMLMFMCIGITELGCTTILFESSAIDLLRMIILHPVGASILSKHICTENGRRITVFYDFFFSDTYVSDTYFSDTSTQIFLLPDKKTASGHTNSFISRGMVEKRPKECTVCGWSPVLVHFQWREDVLKLWMVDPLERGRRVVELTLHRTKEVPMKSQSLQAKDLVDEDKMEKKRPSHSKIKSLKTLKALSLVE